VRPAVATAETLGIFAQRIPIWSRKTFLKSGIEPQSPPPRVNNSPSSNNSPSASRGKDPQNGSDRMLPQGAEAAGRFPHSSTGCAGPKSSPATAAAVREHSPPRRPHPLRNNRPIRLPAAPLPARSPFRRPPMSGTGRPESSRSALCGAVSPGKGAHQTTATRRQDAPTPCNRPRSADRTCRVGPVLQPSRSRFTCRLLSIIDRRPISRSQTTLPGSSLARRFSIVSKIGPCAHWAISRPSSRAFATPQPTTPHNSRTTSQRLESATQRRYDIRTSSRPNYGFVFERSQAKNRITHNDRYAMDQFLQATSYPKLLRLPAPEAREKGKIGWKPLLLQPLCSDGKQIVVANRFASMMIQSFRSGLLERCRQSVFDHPRNGWLCRRQGLLLRNLRTTCRALSMRNMRRSSADECSSGCVRQSSLEPMAEAEKAVLGNDCFNVVADAGHSNGQQLQTAKQRASFHMHLQHGPKTQEMAAFPMRRLPLST